MNASLRRVTIPYSPRPIFLPFHATDRRFAFLLAHRRSGKTVAAINRLIKSALLCRRPDPRCAYIAPYLAQAKDIVWGYLKRYAAPVMAGSPNESELWVPLIGGGRVRLYGADNAARIEGVYLDDCVLDEYQNWDPTVWPQIIRPMLSDRRGRAVFAGKPKGRNHFYEKFKEAEADPTNWFLAVLKASQTGVLPPEELAAARKDMGEELYNQEYELSFDAAIVGAYYGKEIAWLEANGRVASVPWDPAVPVHTAWDLGSSNATVIWMLQIVGKEVHVIDHIASSDRALGWYVNELHKRPYTWGVHLLPHDTKAKELGSGMTREETLIRLGLKPEILPADSVDDGINAVRQLLPRCWFDHEKTDDGLEALKQYRREWDDKMKVFRNRPLHDWTSDHADAFRQAAMGMSRLAAVRQVVPPKLPGAMRGAGGWMGA